MPTSGNHGAALSEIAVLAEGLQVFQSRFAAVRHCENVICMKFDVQMCSRASATSKAAKTIPHEHLKSKAGANLTAISLSPA
jgi:hypothetical protein